MKTIWSSVKFASSQMKSGTGKAQFNGTGARQLSIFGGVGMMHCS